MEKFPTTLIIGLGGVGSRITSRIYQQFIASKPELIEQRNLVCLCFDTDKGDIERYKKIMPKEWVVKTSTILSCTVGEYIDNIKDKTTVLDWFDTRSREVLNMSLDEGAGQIRMASRLAFMAAMDDGKLDAIDGAIRNLLIQEPERHEGNDIKVHIICSLGGGTGAGSFLQTAYYVKDVMRNEHGISNPKITGYFVLADVLCADRVLGFNGDQKENVRTNTYACIKELNAFIHKDTMQVMKPIHFEYKIGQKVLTLPHAKPYDHCYLVDFTTSSGQNLNASQQYYDQLADYVYLNAFTDLGVSSRSKAINDIRQQVERDGSGAYSVMGVSKLVYPVDSLFEYFATQRVADNLSSSWVIIDKQYKEALEAYNEKVNAGGIAVEPNRSLFYRSNVETRAKDGSGFEQLEFNAVFNSVSELDKEGNRTGRKKSQIYLDAVEDFVNDVAINDRLQADYDKVKGGMDNFLEENDEANDVESIAEREENLEKYKKDAKVHIEQVLPQTIKECFLQDYNENLYVSINPNKSRHHLNTYILEKDHELHPLAVRYFLYEVREGIENRLAGLKEDNEALQKKIDELYQLNFNVIDDKNDADDEYKENAQEKMQFVYKRNKTFFKRAWQRMSGTSPIRQCKEDYLSFSGIQRENIKSFAQSKLLENVYSGLLAQINVLIEESERFFDRLPDTLRAIQSESDTLLKFHDDVVEPSVTYVLAESKYKKDIYDEVICANETPFFPKEMSAQIYRVMFENAYNALQRKKKKRELTKDEAERLSAEQLEADLSVFKEVRKLQEQNLRVKHNAFSEMNVIQALREEASRESKTGEELVYMKQVFANLTKKASVRGTSKFNSNNNRPINSWGLNPVCLEPNTLSPSEQAELFGSQDITTNAVSAATIEKMKYFSKYEIVRADSINLLEIEKNFPAFFKTSGTNLSEEKEGSYYKAYEGLINRILSGSDAYSPHLDKNWHLPSYMPNIGLDMTSTMNDIFKALLYGLLFGRLKSKDNCGMDYWYASAVGTSSYYIKSLDGSLIRLKGRSIHAALDDLFEFGLSDNPKLVKKLLDYAQKQWDNALEEWKSCDSSSLESMKAIRIVKVIREFVFSKVYSATNWSSAKYNLFHIVNSNMSTNGLLSNNIEKFRVVLFNELINRFLTLFGPSVNSYNLCRYVFEAIKDADMKEQALAILEDQEHHFEPSTK